MSEKLWDLSVHTKKDQRYNMKRNTAELEWTGPGT